MPKRIKQINYEEKNGKKRVLFLACLIIILLLGSIAVMALIPYFNTLPIYRSYSRTYTTALIDEHSTFNTDHEYVSGSFNSDGDEERLVFSSGDPNVELGDYHEPKYIFADRGGIDSNIRLEFTVKSRNMLNIVLHIYISDEVGENVQMLNDSEVTIATGESCIASFHKEEDIFINKVTVSYTLRIK